MLNWLGDWSTGALYQVGKEFTNKIDLEKGNVGVLSHSHMQMYCDASAPDDFLKTLWQKDELLIMSNFSLF